MWGYPFPYSLALLGGPRNGLMSYGDGPHKHLALPPPLPWALPDSAIVLRPTVRLFHWCCAPCPAPRAMSANPYDLELLAHQHTLEQMLGGAGLGHNVQGQQQQQNRQ